MRDMTRKRFRKWTFPMFWIWCALTAFVGYSGVFLVMLACTMLGDLKEAKRVFKEYT